MIKAIMQKSGDVNCIMTVKKARVTYPPPPVMIDGTHAEMHILSGPLLTIIGLGWVSVSASIPCYRLVVGGCNK